jgi:hypothetical protein
MSCEKPYLTRKTQLLVKTQVDCDTVATLTADDAILVYQDSAVSFELSPNDRSGLASDSLSNRADVMGAKQGTITAKIEITGINENGVPAEDTLLKDSGMKGVTLKKVYTPKHVLGYVPAGIEIENGTGATGILRVPLQDGDGQAWYEPVAGAFADLEPFVEKQATLTSTGVNEAVNRVKIGSIIGGSLREGDILTGADSGAQVRIVRCTRNGDEYLYCINLNATAVTLGERLDGRNKSVIASSLELPVFRIPVTASTLVYKFREGMTINGGTSATAALVLEEYLGKEGFIYVDTTGFVAEALTSSQLATVTESAALPGGVVYSFDSDAEDLVTATLNTDGFARTLWNAESSFTVESEANGIPTMSFTLTGPIEESLTGDFTPLVVEYPEAEPLAFQGAEFKFLDNGVQYSPVLSSISLDAGNSVVVRNDANSPTGVKSAIITSRQPSGSMAVEQVPAAAYDYLSRFFSGRTSGAEWRYNNACGNMVFVKATSLQYSNVGSGDSDGVVSNDISFGLKGKNDDELYIVYTI